jgi:hypothetical protein
VAASLWRRPRAAVVFGEAEMDRDQLVADADFDRDAVIAQEQLELELIDTSRGRRKSGKSTVMFSISRKIRDLISTFL